MKAEGSTVTSRLRISRGDLIFALVVVGGYCLAGLIAIVGRHLSQSDRMWDVAVRVVHGHLDVPSLAGTVDTATTADGRTFLAIGPLQILPYLPFALLGALHQLAGHIIGIVMGIVAAWLTLPLVRRYGAAGALAYWVAGFAAFGTLLFYSAVFGDFYYLAHVESFLALELFLIEWAGKRRPVWLGVCIGFSFLARPTTILAIVPFGLYLLWQRRERWSGAFMAAVAVAVPILAALAVYGWYNWARFGSPLEAGYGLTYLPQPGLEPRRAMGVFALAQIPENLHLAFWALPERLSHFPFFTVSPYGLSMLLVSPALFMAAWAGFRDRNAALLWIAAALVAVPVFLYYGGGYIQYGFRYSLDFQPFLVALVAIGAARWKGWPQKALVACSIASVAYGILWHSFSYLQK